MSLSRQEMEVNKCQIHDFFPSILLTLLFKKGSAMRLCSTWWDAEGELTPESVDEILLGLSSQISEREDPVLCSDVRNNLFGPMEFSRYDFCLFFNLISDLNRVKVFIKI